MRSLALLGITAYQRYVSPHKGYSCAYRAWTGHRSCSVFGYRAIRRHGVWAGLVALRRRFARCAEACATLRTLPPGTGRQRGFCDVGCELPTLDCAGDALNVYVCCDLFGGCGDWGGRKKPKQEPEMVDLTPRRAA